MFDLMIIYNASKIHLCAISTVACIPHYFEFNDNNFLSARKNRYYYNNVVVMKIINNNNI